MPAPVIQSIQYTDTALYIIFDRSISNVSDLGAFAFTQESGNTFTPTFNALAANAIVADSDLPDSLLHVSYTDPGAGVTQVQSDGGDPAEDFVDQLAVAYFAPELVRRVEAGREANDQIRVFFSEPVGSTNADLLTGFTITLDGEPIPLGTATAELNNDQTVLSINTGVNFPYSSSISVEYNAGDGYLYSWPTGDVASFTFLGVPNMSTDGLPDSDYPLSLTIAQPISVVNSVAVPQIFVYLNPVDRRLVKEYGPAIVYTGGTFGETIDNPDGVNIVGGNIQLSDGLIMKTHVGSPYVADAVEAARDWLEVVSARIAIALGKLRAVDQDITPTDTVMRMV